MYCTMPNQCSPASAGGCAVDGRDRHEVDVVDRELAIAIDEVDAAGAHAVDGRDVELHHLHLRRHRPGAALERVPVGGGGVAHAQRDRGDHRRLARAATLRGSALTWALMTTFIVALPVQQHLARAVARHRLEAHHLEHLAQRLRPAGRVLDELDAVQPERVGARRRWLRGRVAWTCLDTPEGFVLSAARCRARPGPCARCQGDR